MDRVASHLAATVRRHRVERQWSIDELVAHSGVSKGAIVAIENESTNPNLGTIVRLADALGVSVTELLEPERPEVVTVVPHASRSPLWPGEDGNEGSSATLILTVPGRTDVEFWRWTLAPGVRYEGTSHPAGTAETVTVLAGSLTLEVDGETVVVSDETTATFGGDRPHAYCAVDQPCTFLMTVHVPHSH